MASLKEVRGRIASVTSTRKITAAMKLVSAAKLRRAQDTIASYLPYQATLTTMLDELVASSPGEIDIPLTHERPVNRLAIIAISSNGSLCGAFNNNVSKKFEEILEQYSSIPQENILVYPIGKKIHDAVVKKGFMAQCEYSSLVDKPDYQVITQLADEMMQLFLTKQIDAVELIYNHFKSAGVQKITFEMLLPIAPTGETMADSKVASYDYILEPNCEYLINELVPKVVRLRMYGALLDSIAAEHGARTTAMQIATDNAQELIQELKLIYNKARQESITNQILDIIGGSESLQ